ncbi:MAG: polysaccharide pyruvyl transferase family protein, partial [Lachnospiraceae bacterium]|nr:polysaccharide pyruvyl transferase family protein [Lachnospiraceae bacterium]
MIKKETRINRLKIGIFGVELESVNFGVAALAITQLKILGGIQKKMNLDMEYYLFSDDNEDKIRDIEDFMQMSGIIPKYLVRIRTGLRGLCRLYRDVEACDLIIDLTYGDSFSDIYGVKNFWLYSIPKIVAIQKKKCLVLAPQTIGPFYHKNVRLGAKYILKKANYVFARDEMSLNCVENLAGRGDIVLTSDLAMGLPFQKEQKRYIKDKKINVGLNVSSLLWMNDLNDHK